VYQVYGTDQSLADLVPYYQEKLAARGWTQSREYIPDDDVAIVFNRGKEELIEFFTRKFVAFAVFVREVPPDKLGQYETVYILQVVETQSSCPVP
jgi:hypothetical protein